MDQFQLVLGDNEVGLVRESWEAAAQDAVSAGLAAWVWDQFPNAGPYNGPQRVGRPSER